ncbi:hypothetical protein F4820DRAFT_458572 [Hypoxylon rubiginosum]|uniref:Uncharacterized protein n=1 Tax=Hypoxylon rubiginosum TaxID=110542 RepID=A0ACB9Z0U7_9PEZI|nr:hypothetical protein F4820DRAFT_458572 [Hypoxylon rubiginosum]
MGNPTTVEHPQVEEHSPTFSPLRQVYRLFRRFLLRWLLTAIICGAFTVVLKQYDKQVYLQDGNTHIYNAVTAGLTICLSLNLDSSLNAFAAALKWVILARKSFQPKVFDLILAFDNSKINAIKLLWQGGSWKLRLLCVVWLFIALAAQVGTALIGLTYSMVPLSPDSDYFPMPHGEGFTASFTQIGAYAPFHERGAPLPSEPEDSLYNLTVQRSNAFAYGVGAISSGIQFLDGTEGLSFHSEAFNETSRTYTSGISNYPAWAQNSLTWWNVIGRGVDNGANCSDPFTPFLDSDLDSTNITFNGYNGTQTFTISQSPLDYITYISDTSLSCGPRCTQVYVLFSAGGSTDMFVCNSTVGWMYDWVTYDWITQQNLSMPDTQARILAGAIGWGDIDINGTLDADSLPGRFQASSFPNGSYWAPWFVPSKTGLSDYYIARFATAAIVIMDQYGVSNTFSDLVIPGVASQLDVKWTYSVLILVLIPGLQALLGLICIFVVYRKQVPVHEDSPLAIATLLKYVVSENPSDTLPSGSQTAKEMTSDLVYARALGETSNDLFEIRVASKEGNNEGILT